MLQDLQVKQCFPYPIDFPLNKHKTSFGVTTHTNVMSQGNLQKKEEKICDERKKILFIELRCFGLRTCCLKI